MRMGEPLQDREREPKETDLEFHTGARSACLRDSVTSAVKDYLIQLDGQLGNEVYQMVLTEVEAPLLEEIMAYTRNNQTKASRMLGLNRGTLRKKLKQYGLLAESDT
jgi:Fis family transcriptional regulator